MPTFESQMFFLGNFADMDTNEGDTNTEFAANILGSYTQPALIDISVNDGDNDGAIIDDELGTTPGEDVVYDLGSGPTTQFIDSTIVYNIRVTLGDNSTIDIQATAIQTQNGDVFLTDFANNGSFDNLSVQNIALLSVTGSNYSGFFANSSVDNTQVVCFAAGTLIFTRNGPVPVQNIAKGTEVWTADHGFQRCIETTKRCLSYPGRKRAPIQIAAGALGPDVPSTPLRLSPQHRVLISSPVAKRMFGTTEVLVPAKDLLNIDGITQVLPFLPVDYYHLLCAEHEVLCASGVLVESLFGGIEASRAAPILQSLQNTAKPARLMERGHKARKMLERHRINCAPKGKPFSPRPNTGSNVGIDHLVHANILAPAML